MSWGRWLTGGFLTPHQTGQALAAPLQRLSGAMQTTGAGVNSAGGLSYGGATGYNANSSLDANGNQVANAADVPTAEAASGSLSTQPTGVTATVPPPATDTKPTGALATPAATPPAVDATPHPVNTTRDPASQTPYYAPGAAINQPYYASGTANKTIALPSGATGIQPNLLVPNSAHTDAPAGTYGAPGANGAIGTPGNWLPAGWVPEQAPPGSVTAMALAKGIDPRQYTTPDEFQNAYLNAMGLGGSTWGSGG